MKSRAFHFFLLYCSALGVSHAAESLSVVPDSAQALGIVGGRFANLRDASAVRVSPANILEIQQPELLINTAMWYGDIRLDSTSGASVKMSQPWVFPASMYFVLPVKPGKLAFGLGVSTPFGMASEYPKDMDVRLRYALPYKASLLAVDITPAVAFKVTESLSLALGLDIIYSDLQFKRVYPWGALPGLGGSPDGEIDLHGDGWGLGGYLGANWKIAKGHRLAFVGRLPVKIHYEGSFYSLNMPAPLLAGGFTEQGRFDSDMTFPGSLALGYGIDITERWTVGFDFQYSFNSSHDDIPINIANNQGLLGGTNTALLGWRDSIDLGVGTSYSLNESWTLRGGYLFSENSMPSVNYLPSAATNDRHVFSLGMGWRGKSRGVDLTYAFVYNPIRVIGDDATPVFSGNYKHQWHVVSLSFTQRF